MICKSSSIYQGRALRSMCEEIDSLLVDMFGEDWENQLNPEPRVLPDPHFTATMAMYAGVPGTKWDKIKSHLARFREGAPHVKPKYITPEAREALERIAAEIAASETDEVYLEARSWSKYFGAQGGTPVARLVREGILQYFPEEGQGQPYLPYPSDGVVGQFKQQIDTSRLADMLPLTWKQIVALIDWHKSNSGIIGFGDRRLPENANPNLIYALLGGEIGPSVAGARVQRNKPCRNIFMDMMASLVTYYQNLRWLKALLKNSDFAAWRGDRYVSRQFLPFMQRNKGAYSVFEFDYETFDRWVTLRLAVWLMRLIERVLGMFPGTLDYTIEFWKQIFTAPVIAPADDGSPVLIRGLHALFSGLPPTNDLETWLNIAIQLMFIDYITGGRLHEMERGKDFVLIVLGDDVSIMIRNEWLTVDPDSVGELFAQWVWDNFRIKANASKQRIVVATEANPTPGTNFCKRAITSNMKMKEYKDGTFPEGAYPVVLAINGIINPEEDRDDPEWVLGRVISVCDNAWGNPKWKRFVAAIYDHVVRPLICGITGNVVEIDLAAHAEWRQRLYGEVRSLATSPSAAYFAKRIQSEPRLQVEFIDKQA